MNLVWKIEISGRAKKDLKSIDKVNSKRILNFIREKISVNPQNFGEPLKGSRFEGLWRYRVGNYRIITEINNNTISVLIARIGHRKDIYKR